MIIYKLFKHALIPEDTTLPEGTFPPEPELIMESENKNMLKKKVKFITGESYENSWSRRNPLEGDESRHPMEDEELVIGKWIFVIEHSRK